jgi:type VI secretion system secreted protein VgrG
VSVQAQSDVVKVTADKMITVASVTKSVNIAAKEHVMLTAQGAYMKLEGGNIMIHGPGTMEFKASMKELAGPASASVAAPMFPHGDVVLGNDFHRYAAQYQVLAGELTMPNQAYVLTLPDGNKYFGETDADGRTVKIGTLQPKDVKLTLLEKEDWDQENINVWHQEMDKNWD